MSLGAKSNFIPVVYAGTRKKKYNKKNGKRKKLRGENPNDEKIHGRRVST